MASPRSPSTKKRTIALNNTEAPLDYSFYSLTVLQDIGGWEPRKGFMPAMKSEVLDSEPRAAITYPGHKNQKQDSRSRSRCFKLNNNCLNEVSEIRTIAEELFENVDDIAWLDLSFNELTKIDDIVTEFPNLQILYLHGNQISDLKEVEKLARLPQLKKLSLHGNPLEDEKGYKYLVQSMLPQLQVLDFSRITKADRRTSDTLSKMMGNTKKNKKKVESDD